LQFSPHEALPIGISHRAVPLSIFEQSFARSIGLVVTTDTMRLTSPNPSIAGCAPIVHVNMHCRAVNEFLNGHLFDNLRHARSPVAEWRDIFNNHRPHSSLTGLTPRVHASIQNVAAAFAHPIGYAVL